MSSDMNATANGTPLDAAAGQPLPATLGHFGRLAAAVAAEQEQRKHDPLPEFGDASSSKGDGGGTKEVPSRGGDSPEPLRVRSPGSLREPSRSPQQGAPASEGERRFSHEPWNWKLGSAPERGQEEVVQLLQLHLMSVSQTILILASHAMARKQEMGF